MDEARQDPVPALARVFRLLGDESRLAILNALRGREHSVGELAGITGLSRSLVSHHVATLGEAGLIRLRKDPTDGRRTLAALEADTWRHLEAAVGDFGTDGRRRASAGRAEVLQDQPYFATLSKADLAVVAGALREERYPNGKVIFSEGDPCPGLYVVAKGRVKIYTTSPDGKEQVLRIMGPGESFNEVPAFDGGPNPASAAAVEPAVVYLLPLNQVQELLQASPAFAAAVARMFAARLRHFVKLVEDLSFRHVVSRVAKILLQSIQPGEGIGAGSGRHPLTQREMAEMAGTAREVVSRALKNLEQQGLIRMERGRIAILNRDRLERLL